MQSHVLVSMGREQRCLLKIENRTLRRAAHTDALGRGLLTLAVVRH
jgi:hypothetical protein